MRVLLTILGEGFTCEVREFDDGRVEFIADADIDADGANGQHGAKAAYKTDDSGSEALANGGMKIRGGKVAGGSEWYRDIVITDKYGNPRVFPGGIIASRTAYKFPDKGNDDPTAYVDSETVPYIVVPPQIIQRTKGAVLGCKAQVTHLKNGRLVEAVVADVGPRSKVGELSIEAARVLGIPSSPRRGGEDRPVLKYELWPGVPALVNGCRYALQRSNGTYVVMP